MTQEAMPPRDPVGEWYDTYSDYCWQKRFEAMQRDQSFNDPWVNGEHALAAIVAGLVVMFLLSVGVSL